MTLRSRFVALRSTRRPRTLAVAALLVLAGGASATACGSSARTDLNKAPAGAAADAGQGGDASLGTGGGTHETGGSIAVGAQGGSGTKGGGKGGSSGGDAVAGASDGVTGGSSGTAGTAGSVGLPALGTTQCSDGIDNDGDGLIDGLDPECTGPWDNDESSFATGIPGDNKDPKWQDCFFDGNSGAGDDRCRYPTTCLTGELSQDDPQCAVTQACIDNCAPAVPNGCDCFGCCSVELADGSSVDIFEASTCSLANIDDTTACPRCSKSTLCQNPCGECELCPGKTVDDLPASCTPPATGTGGSDGSGGSSGTAGTDSTGGTSGTTGTGGTGSPPPPAYTCDGGQQVCGPGLAACPEGLYCSLGCCTVVVR
ncbi:MAG TPA: hypothetical protein VMI54_08070 [Polyangiaceae bacterium]|nr:hypothetical protein [Polyangiaceae bacterium]